MNRKEDCAELEKNSTPDSPPVEYLTLADRTEHPVLECDVQSWADAFPKVDIVGELKKMKVWLNANPTKRKTKRGINAFIVNWLGREQDRPSHAKPSGGGKHTGFNQQNYQEGISDDGSF